MKVQTHSGVENVTDNQLDWLGATGELRDMSNYPQLLPVYDGTALELKELLQSMPAGWSQKPIEPAPPDPVDSGQPDKQEEGLDLLRTQNGLLESINENLDYIVAFIEQIRLPR